MIDLNRLDITKPIDLTAICKTGLFDIDPEKKHYGFNLTDEVNIKIYYFVVITS